MKFLMVYKYDQIDYFINQKNREKLEKNRDIYSTFYVKLAILFTLKIVFITVIIFKNACSIY